MGLTWSAAPPRIYTEERARSRPKPLYETIVLAARREGLRGATVLRGPMRRGESQRIHNANNLDLGANLPLVSETVYSRERLRAFVPIRAGDLFGAAGSTAGKTLRNARGVAVSRGLKACSGRGHPRPCGDEAPLVPEPLRTVFQ